MATPRYLALVREDEAVVGRRLTYLDMISESINADQSYTAAPTMARRGDAGERKALGSFNVSGSISGVASAESFGHFLMGTLGQVHSFDRNLGADTQPMEHVFFSDPNLEIERMPLDTFCIATAKDEAEFLYTGCYMNSLTINCTAGEVVTFDCDIVGSNEIVTDTPVAEGTTASTRRFSFADEEHIFDFHKGNLQITNSNAAQYDLDPTSFTVTINSNISDTRTLQSRFLGRRRIINDCETHTTFTSEDAGVTLVVANEATLYRFGTSCVEIAGTDAADGLAASDPLSYSEDWTKYDRVGYWFRVDATLDGDEAAAEDPFFDLFDTSTTYASGNSNTLSAIDLTDTTEDIWWRIVDDTATAVANAHALNDTCGIAFEMPAAMGVGEPLTVYLDVIEAWNTEIVNFGKKEVTGSFDMIFHDSLGLDTYKSFLGGYTATTPVDCIGTELKLRLTLDTCDLVEVGEVPTYMLTLDMPSVIITSVSIDESSRDQITATFNFTCQVFTKSANTDYPYDARWDAAVGGGTDFDDHHIPATDIPIAWDIMAVIQNDDLSTIYGGTENY